MATFMAGLLLKDLREKKGLAMKQVCEGICSVSTLSRIEKGIQNPYYMVFTSLMTRLGCNPEKYYFSVTDREEFDFISQMRRIEELIYDRDFKEAVILLLPLEEKNAVKGNEPDDTTPAGSEGDKDNSAEKMKLQIIMTTRAIIDFNLTQNYSSVMDTLSKALLLTMPDFNEDKLEGYLLSTEEAKIVSWTACTYYELGEIDRSIRVFYKLKESIDRYYTDVHGITRIYTTVIYNLTKALGLQGRYTEVIELCDAGLHACIKNKSFYSAPSLAVNKGYALIKKGEVEEGKSLLIFAYGALKIHGEHKVAEILKQNAENEFGIRL